MSSAPQTSQNASSLSTTMFPSYRLRSVVAFEQLQTADRKFLEQYPDLFVPLSVQHTPALTSKEWTGSVKVQPMASGTVQLTNDNALIERTRQHHLETFVSGQREDIEGLLYRLRRYEGWFKELNSQKSIKSQDSLGMSFKDLCEIDLLHSIINTCKQKLRAILEVYALQADLFLWVQQANGSLATQGPNRVTTNNNPQEVTQMREKAIIKAAMAIVKCVDDEKDRNDLLRFILQGICGELCAGKNKALNDS